MPASTALTTHDGHPPRDPLADKLALASRGDQGAFAEIYDDTAPRVFGLALRVIGDPHRAEQVAQGAFADIWRQAARFDRTQGSAIAWVMALAHRRAVECVRSTRDTDRHDGSRDAGTGNATSFLVSSTGLTGAERRTVELAYLDGYTHTDVSWLMQEQPGVTQARLGGALRRLSE